MKFNKLMRFALAAALLSSGPAVAMNGGEGSGLSREDRENRLDPALLGREDSHKSCDNSTPDGSPDKPQAAVQQRGNQAHRGALALGEHNVDEQDADGDAPYINHALVNAAQRVIVNFLERLPHNMNQRRENPFSFFALMLLAAVTDFNFGDFQIPVEGSPSSQNIRRINEAARILLEIENWPIVREGLIEVTPPNSPYRTPEIARAVLANETLKWHVKLVQLLQRCWLAN